MMKRWFLAIALVAAAVSAGAQGHMNVEPSSYGYDPNKLLLNPQWKCQKLNNCSPKPQVPDADILCDAKNPPPKCTTQPFNIDRPAAVFKKLICSLERNSKIHGHLNFRPVTFYGRVEWEGVSDDFDFNFGLTPARGNGLTKAKPSIHSEFDSRETLMAFRKLPGWWGDFLAVARDRLRHKEAKKMIGSSEANGVITGLFGLDCEHDCASELHPIYLIGIRRPVPLDQPERWVVLARNSGNEGFCSSRRHPIGRDELHLLLPNKIAKVVGQPAFYGTAKNMKAPVVTPVAETGVMITFTVKDREVIVGEIDLERSPTGGIGSFTLPRMAAAMSDSIAAEVAEREERNSAEGVLRRLIEQRPASETYDIEAFAAPRQDTLEALVEEPNVLTPEFRPTMTAEEYRARLAQLAPPSYGAADVDREQAENDERIWRGLCAAYNGKLPDPRLKDACKE